MLLDGDKVSEVSYGGTPDAPADAARLEANGATLLPGLADSHCHPFEVGWLKRSVDLRGTANITGLRLRLSSRIQRSRPGEWVTGMGWDQQTLAEGRMPDRSDIDDLSPSNPVALSRVCGHIALLNTAAISLLSLEGAQGVESERDGSGRLTGIFKERAMEDIFARIPKQTQDCADDLLSVEVEAARYGLTALHCITSPASYREELDAIARLASAGVLSLRYRLYIPAEAMCYVAEKGLRSSFDGERVRINGVKVYADGSLGARTAALRQPYSDDPGTSGILRHTDEELSTLVERADSEGYQVIVHAIGDRAVEQAVDALSRVTGARNPQRHRIEHASLLPKDLLSKMSRHGIRAGVQPLFATSDTWAAERLGEERVRDLYPFKSMLSAGIIASGGSDAPVESMSPALGLWASMARGEFAPEENLTLDEALRLYTQNAGSNGFDDTEDQVREGGTANLTLLDSDVEGMHPSMVRKVGVAATVVHGSLVYSYAGEGS